MNEAQTRQALIDPALTKAGWKDSDIKKEFAITQGRLIGKGQRGTALKADYVLEYKGRKLAVIEAKAKDKYYTQGLSQAKNYARKLHIRFAYATNGVQIYQVDLEQNQQGEVERFPSPEELWQMSFDEPKSQAEQTIQQWQEKFRQIPFESKGGTWQPRYYQEIAIDKTLEAIAHNQHRILLNLATGTGKTAIAFQIVWKLFKSRWNLNQNYRPPRILFLADRNILADQAFNAFSAFGDKIDEHIRKRISPNEIRKEQKVPTNGNIFFTIFQTFTSNFSKETEEDEKEKIQFNFGAYPKYFFDLIIIDECHRGGANDKSSWRGILEYFSPAMQLGLTATPKRDVNVDTYEYFGKPVYTYSLKEGIDDGFLSPFRVQRISSTIDDYEHTEDNKVLAGDVKQGDRFIEKDFNSNIEIEDRELYRVKQFLKFINPNHKSLVFCKTQKHALLIRDSINKNDHNKSADYCQRVTADEGSLGEQYLKDFQDNEKTIPTILTTSYKLSTGVDAPEIRNIILLRPVHSMIEFKQIIGRGTRLFEGKDYFTIYDFVGAYKKFNDSEWDGEPLEVMEREQDDDDNIVAMEETKQCKACNQKPCICEKPKRQMIQIQLSETNYRSIDSMVETKFLDPEGQLINAADFIKNLFGYLPEFFTSEEELRVIWSNPKTRADFLQQLYDNGYSKDSLKELQKLIHAQDSDLFDVLNYIAYNKSLIPRTKRVNNAKGELTTYDEKQKAFVNFVLKQYEENGIAELDYKKLPNLIKLKYKDNATAKNELGDNKRIRELFMGFQKYLYVA